MSKSQIDARKEEGNEKMTKIPPLGQPKATVELAQEHPAGMMSEGDRILGMTRENSGWDVYNNEARKVDTELVKDWTASLNFLLIFAAIFAAVLTAFIIESKKMLEPDPMDTMLDVMIFYTNNVANGTHTPYNRTQFEAGTPAVVVNSLFFGSLSASLVAALASVVALQWVADYDAAIPRGGSSPEDRAKRRQFRYAGVVWWKMSEIIAALPLLLYFSVMLFFAGLILWMWNTNHTVGVVVTAGTAVAVLFYVTSTMVSVAFVSAPFRTPLSRWIYTLCHLTISALYSLLRAMRISAIPDWIKTRHSLATTSYRREDRAVENTEMLGRDALIWLANQISISQDSYRRLLLLVGELPNLKAEHLPSLDSAERLWYRIFDLLGWRYLRRGPSAITNVEERRRGMETLHRCYKVPAIQQLVDPVGREKLMDCNYPGYWSRYCDSAEAGQWRINHDHPNHLFLLLRDMPCPSDFSAREIEITSRLSQWRNQEPKGPQAWDEVFSDTTSLSAGFFSSCVGTFGDYCVGKEWHLRDPDERKMYRLLARKVVQQAVMRDDFLPLATGQLIRAYEALLVGYSFRRHLSDPACLALPILYCRHLQGGSTDDHATHEAIILLLSRQIKSASEEERVLRVKDIITMLWLRPSNPVPRKWDYLEAIGESEPEVDMKMTLDWIKNADLIPHILEILRHLATAQKRDPTIGPLWRATVPGQINDPHFVEALLTFDRLMAMDRLEHDHRLLFDLICQDLELEPYPDFDDYFTPSRLKSLTSLRDPCLKILVGCARGPDFLSPVTLPEAYTQARFYSLEGVAGYVYKRFSTIDSPAALQLQASLWPIASHLYANAMQDAVFFGRLQRMFQYTVPCYECLDGDSHLVFHLLKAAGSVTFYQNATKFRKTSYRGQRMAVPLVIIRTLCGGETPSLARYFPQAKEHILRKLEDEIKEISRSQFHLLVMVWNSMGMLGLRFPEDIRVILAGIQAALQLPSDWRATSILAPLSLKMRLLRDNMLGQGRLQFAAQEEIVDEQVDITSQLLLSNLAARSIFGRYNSNRVSCARAIGDIRPALGWLPLYAE